MPFYRKTLSLIVIIFLYSFCELCAFDLTEDQSSRIAILTEKAYNDKLLEALDGFEKIIAEIPDHPVGYFYKIAILDKIQADYFTTLNEKKFGPLFNKSFKVGQKFIKNYPYNPLGYFFLGAIQGYHGLHYFRTESRLSVFMSGVRAVKNLQKAVNIDENLYDAYYGLGIYYYYKSEKAPFLYFFGKGRDKDKQKGIKSLRLAATKGTYGTFEARGSLVKVLIYEEEYSQALKMLSESIQKYPESVYRWRFRASVYKKMGDWENALNDNTMLIDLIAKKKYSGSDAFVDAFYNQGFFLAKLKENEEAINYFSKCINIRKSFPKKKGQLSQLVRKAKKQIKRLRAGKSLISS